MAEGEGPNGEGGGVMLSLLLLIAVAEQGEAYRPPSAAAMALASALSDRPVAAAEVDRTVNGIAQTLLTTIPASRGVGCDPEVPACRSAAERLAREAAEPLLAERRAMKDRMFAIVIDETMRPAEIADATTFARTPAGRSFATALDRLTNVTAMSPAVRQRLTQAMVANPPGNNMRELFERFHDMTRTLPRRTRLLAPPPPQPSLPVRKP